jgi:hypothetical protein
MWHNYNAENLQHNPRGVPSWNESTIEHIYDSESALNCIWNQEQDGVFDQSRTDADAILVVRQLL